MSKLLAILIFPLCCLSQVGVEMPVLYQQPSSGFNTCPTPNTTFGTSNVVWIESSTVVPASDGVLVTSVPNLLCAPNLAVSGTNYYFTSGGGSNLTYTSRVVDTNNVWHLSCTNRLTNSSDYVVMAVLKFPNAPSKANTGQDIFRGCNASISAQNNVSINYDGSGKISQFTMQGDGAGFITFAYTDNAAWHLWTFIQSNGVAYIRQDGTQKATGSVANSTDFGNGSDHTWYIGSSLGSGFINLEWTRFLLWTNHLGASDLTNYEGQCITQFKLK